RKPKLKSVFQICIMRFLPKREDVRVVCPVRFDGLFIGAKTRSGQRGCLDSGDRGREYRRSKIGFEGEAHAFETINEVAATCHDGNADNNENGKTEGLPA